MSLQQPVLRAMLPADWHAVADIYTQALQTGQATFETVCPDYAAWNRAHLPDCRLVLEQNDRVVGWCALSPTSAREAYRGVAEVSVYVDETAQHRGYGSLLLRQLCTESARLGYWCLFAAIFSGNTASLQLHRACGFREIGYRERIARDRFGVWQNTVLFERRVQG